ncbi:MAG: tetratricopeptide repeat protein [Thermoanaerobaculia bacterium]
MQHLTRTNVGRWTVPVLVALCVGGPARAADRKQIESGVRTSYPSILASWAAGDSETALTRLAELERRLVGPDFAPADIEALWKAKLGVLRDLMGEVGEDVLVPIMLLHHDAYLEYRLLDLPILAQHSRVMAEELAAFYADKRQDQASARGVAASLLTSLGGHLQQGWSWKHSAELFSRATEIYARSDAAHLGLGALYERRAELPEAVEHFREAVSINSDNQEARLRLGVCLKREGDSAGARTELSRLVDSGAPDWIDVIASEELAALTADGGGDPEALLEAARRRHPDSSRLAIQLARWLDSQGRGPEAEGLLEDAFLRDGSESESPRYRYNRWSTTELETVRQELREAAAGRQPLLASAVEGLSVQGAP